MPLPCKCASLILPILEYDHNAGCSITGGYAYRGTQVPFLYGKYLFGDFCSGTIWWAAQNNGTWSTTAFPPTAGSSTPSGRTCTASCTSARATGRCPESDDEGTG